VSEGGVSNTGGGWKRGAGYGEAHESCGNRGKLFTGNVTSKLCSGMSGEEGEEGKELTEREKTTKHL